MSREVSKKLIATTEDTGDPVVRVWIGDSKADIIIDQESKCLNVWRIESEKRGDMKKIMDSIVEATSYNWVQFIAPMSDTEKDIADEVAERIGASDESKYETDDNNRNIRDVLEGFQDVTEHHDGMEVPMLVGFWETDR